MERASRAASAEDHQAGVSDETLLSRYRDGARPEDFQALVQRYERELYRYLVRYLGDASLADDVFQNTFLQVHLKRHQYEDGRPVRPWLYTIATHQAVDALRKRKRQSAVSLDQVGSGGSGGDLDPTALVDLLVSEDPEPTQAIQGEEQRELIRAGVARLPDLLKQTLILAYYQGLKYREIAEMLGVPVGTVKSRLHAALAKLQTLARAANPDDDHARSQPNPRDAAGRRARASSAGRGDRSEPEPEEAELGADDA